MLEISKSNKIMQFSALGGRIFCLVGVGLKAEFDSNFVVAEGASFVRLVCTRDWRRFVVGDLEVEGLMKTSEFEDCFEGKCIKLRCLAWRVNIRAV